MVTKKIKKMVARDLQYYLNLPWTYTIEHDIDQMGKHVFVIRVNELPGVVTDNYSIEQGIKDLKEEVMPVVFQMYLDHGQEIPEPIDESKFQGNIAYRTTPRKHYLIAREAQKRKQSLSQVIDSLIDAGFASKKQ